MNCIRCDKDLGHADSNNADYVIADEFIVPEKREQFYAVTIDKDKKESFTPIKQTTDSLLIPDVKRIEVKIQDVDIQKTGMVCPECYQETTDFIIWGIHKNTK